MLQIRKAAANHPPTDDAHIMNIESEDPIEEKDQMEENYTVGSAVDHLVDEDGGETDLCVAKSDIQEFRYYYDEL